MPQEISFLSEGTQCSGLLFIPTDHSPAERRPAVVLGPGFGRVKDDPGLLAFAQQFTEAGLISLVIDYRRFGKSKGEPRQYANPLDQVEDYRNAITWLSQRPEVDPLRIGVWGSSLSGGHVLQVAAYDKRVRAVVSQSATVSGWDALKATNRAEQFAGLLEMLLQERIRRYQEGTPRYVKIVASEGEPSLTQDPESRAYMLEMAASCPSWRNELDMQSLEKFLEYNPGANVHLISPTPLLMIVPDRDRLSQTDLILSVYQRALEPKSLELIKGSHFAVYSEPGFTRAVAAASQWFRRHLT